VPYEQREAVARAQAGMTFRGIARRQNRPPARPRPISVWLETAVLLNGLIMKSADDIKVLQSAGLNTRSDIHERVLRTFSARTDDGKLTGSAGDMETDYAISRKIWHRRGSRSGRGGQVLCFATGNTAWDRANVRALGQYQAVLVGTDTERLGKTAAGQAQ
jgi:hypothetical protein